MLNLFLKIVNAGPSHAITIGQEGSRSTFRRKIPNPVSLSGFCVRFAGESDPKRLFRGRVCRVRVVSYVAVRCSAGNGTAKSVDATDLLYATHNTTRCFRSASPSQVLDVCTTCDKNIAAWSLGSELQRWIGGIIADKHVSIAEYHTTKSATFVQLHCKILGFTLPHDNRLMASVSSHIGRNT